EGAACGSCLDHEVCVDRPVKCPDDDHHNCSSGQVATCVPEGCLLCSPEQECRWINNTAPCVEGETCPEFFYYCQELDYCGGCDPTQICEFAGLGCINGSCEATFHCVPKDYCGGCLPGQYCDDEAETPVCRPQSRCPQLGLSMSPESLVCILERWISQACQVDADCDVNNGTCCHTRCGRKSCYPLF
ncbi:lectin, partial [Aplysia californica]|uniref:Lectin n=1 Tax=Aplysia californica TaxID=6500 RepID=A0ABM1A856_APLCA